LVIMFSNMGTKTLNFKIGVPKFHKIKNKSMKSAFNKKKKKYTKSPHIYQNTQMIVALLHVANWKNFLWSISNSHKYDFLYEPVVYHGDR